MINRETAPKKTAVTLRKTYSWPSLASARYLGLNWSAFLFCSAWTQGSNAAPLRIYINEWRFLGVHFDPHRRAFYQRVRYTQVRSIYIDSTSSILQAMMANVQFGWNATSSNDTSKVAAYVSRSSANSVRSVVVTPNRSITSQDVTFKGMAVSGSVRGATDSNYLVTIASLAALRKISRCRQAVKSVRLTKIQNEIL